MIGLKRGIVKLLPHNKKWKLLFENEEKKIEKKLGDLVIDIQHIGSTSIPGIPAKPIIDISMGVRVMKDAKKLIKPLEKLGYELRREFGRPNIQTLFVKGPESKRTHYLHVMKYNGALWKNDLRFRDYLRKHPVRAKQYAELKNKLAGKHANDRGTYTKSKAKFILETIKKAQKMLK
ncbi:GrpB family protein [Candidatus Wolfebacteria bacterium]|nr:GrpB family protein [Candidatus Wolfebacteria bacterium]